MKISCKNYQFNYIQAVLYTISGYCATRTIHEYCMRAILSIWRRRNFRRKIRFTISLEFSRIPKCQRREYPDSNLAFGIQCSLVYFEWLDCPSTCLRRKGLKMRKKLHSVISESRWIVFQYQSFLTVDIQTSSILFSMDKQEKNKEPLRYYLNMCQWS